MFCNLAVCAKVATAREVCSEQTWSLEEEVFYSISQCIRPWLTFTLDYPFKIKLITKHHWPVLQVFTSLSYTVSHQWFCSPPPLKLFYFLGPSGESQSAPTAHPGCCGRRSPQVCRMEWTLLHFILCLRDRGSSQILNAVKRVSFPYSPSRSCSQALTWTLPCVVMWWAVATLSRSEQPFYYSYIKNKQLEFFGLIGLAFWQIGKMKEPFFWWGSYN